MPLDVIDYPGFVGPPYRLPQIGAAVETLSNW